MTRPNCPRKKSGLRPLPEDKDLFVYANLTRDPVKERRLVDQIRKDVEQLEMEDRASKAAP